MFELDGPPTVERFELVLLSLRTPAGTIAVPVVDGWIELQMALGRVPDRAERAAFFAALGGLCAALRADRPDLRWYFLHKAPGLKLRFRLGLPDAALLETLLGSVAAWPFDWIRASGLGSVFDQAELMPAAFRDDAARLLAHAADGHLAAARADRQCGEEAWAEFLVRLLAEVGLDAWLAHEALARLRRLRTVALAAEDAAAEPLLDPAPLLARPLAPFTPGFAASVALLQTINLLLNMWAVGAGAQRRILDRALAATRPELLAAVDG